MIRKKKIIDYSFTLDQLRAIESNYKHLSYLNSNDENKSSLLAVGCYKEVVFSEDYFKDLAVALGNKDWLFGYFGYDLKNQTEPILSSKNKDFVQFEEAHFYAPTLVFEFNENQTVVHYFNEADINDFLVKVTDSVNENTQHIVSLEQQTSKETYLNHIEKIKKYLTQGDIYEVNYCHSFISDNCVMNPTSVYLKLNGLTNAPFSCFHKNGSQYVLSASPERFLKKTGSKILSEPIKGTAKRGINKTEDDKIKLTLENDPKERAENIMIVDLVRNDLSRTAAKGSVKVEELCKVYSFDTVHQMISRVTSELHPNYTGLDALRFAFPMGSMTGAPKISAMQIIEELEENKRGVYSGALGYFHPNGDFDFNVLIRSILYNKDLNRSSFTVGGAITLKSNPESEYEETLLKAAALKQALNE